LEQTPREGIRTASHFVDHDRDDQTEDDDANTDDEAVDVLVIIKKLIDLVGVLHSGLQIRGLNRIHAVAGFDERSGENCGDESGHND
jgi:hypothetical protein